MTTSDRPVRRAVGAPGPARGVSSVAVVACALVLAVSCAGQVMAQGGYDDALSLARSVADRYDSSSSYRIEFVQESYWALADTTAVSKGTLLAEPPSLFAIDYDDGGRVVAAGGSLWVSVPQTNQFFSSGVDTVDVALDPAGILRAYRPDNEQPFLEAADGYRTVQLRPSGSIPEPSRLSITIDERRSVVTEITAYATTGDKTTYRMTKTTFDVDVPEGAFEPPRPPRSKTAPGERPGSP
jgi:outer membrane lipoprotein-sorting protein